jgi:transcriptional regulator with XRE-family HTH domain
MFHVDPLTCFKSFGYGLARTKRQELTMASKTGTPRKQSPTPRPDDELVRMGATIRAIREKSGASVDELANAVGVSRPQMSNVEAGRRRISNVLLARIAEALSVPQIAIMWPQEGEDIIADIDYRDPKHRRTIRWARVAAGAAS